MGKTEKQHFFFLFPEYWVFKDHQKRNSFWSYFKKCGKRYLIKKSDNVQVDDMWQSSSVSSKNNFKSK